MTYEDEKRSEEKDRKIETAWMEADRELEKAIGKRVAAGNEMAVLALRRLMKWVPECGFPKSITPVYCDEVTIVEQYRKEQRLNSPGPFCSETYTYELWGKEDARTFLALLGQVARALGLDAGLHDRRLR